MRHFLLGPAAFFIPTVRCAYRIDCHQCTTLNNDQKSKRIDFPHNDVSSTNSGSLDQDLRNTICQTWLPKVVKTILTSLFYRCTVHSDIFSVHSPTNAFVLI